MANIIGNDGDNFIFGTNEKDTIVGLKGDDQLFGLQQSDDLYGDIKEDIILDFVSLSNTEPTVYDMHNIPDFGDDKINGGNGNDKLYGDAKNFEIYLTGADNVPDYDESLDPEGDGFVDAYVLVRDLVIEFGSDELDGSNGDDEIFGDIENFSIVMRSGSNGGVDANSSVFLGSSVFLFQTGAEPDVPVSDGLFLTFGDDKLFGGSGADKLYGDLKEFNFDFASPDQMSPTGSLSATGIYNSTILFGDDYLYGQSGDDYLYGDARTLNINIKSGDHDTRNPGYYAAGATFGKDELYGDQGKDHIFGDVRDFNNILIAGNNNGSIDGSTQQISTSVIYYGDFTFGRDNLYGGQGSDNLYGDAETWTLLLIGGDNADAKNESSPDGSRAAVRIQSQTFLFGSDVLEGGSGHDYLIGDVDEASWILKAGDDGKIDARQFVSIDGVASGSLTEFGADTLYGGSGNDYLCGDVRLFEMDFDAGDRAEGDSVFIETAPIAGLFFNANLIFGHDDLFGGNGEDHLYGDVQILSMNSVGGLESNQAGEFSETGVRASAGFTTFGPPNHIEFGEDGLTGGNGNDNLFGEGELFHFNAMGGSSVRPGDSDAGHFIDVRAGLINTSVVFEDDTLEGGSGNDILYGDWKSFDITLKDGIGSNLDGSAGDGELIEALIYSLKFGDDMIYGGSGNDILVGDLEIINFEHLDGFGELLTSNIIDPNSNVGELIWGNDTLAGGPGSDIFAFILFEADDGLSMQGHDTLIDFNEAEGDRMQFNGVTDIESLNAVTEFDSSSNVGGGAGNDTVITFVGGGAITLFDSIVGEFTLENTVFTS